MARPLSSAPVPERDGPGQDLRCKRCGDVVGVDQNGKSRLHGMPPKGRHRHITAPKKLCSNG
jgi:tRNA(Ile2) C34 agmatinyltransferase TiaS